MRSSWRSAWLATSLLFFSAIAQAYSEKVPQKVDVLIIGSGLTGLSSAFYLKEKNRSYHILEMTPRVGGRVRTMKYNQPDSGDKTISVDAGMEEYWQSNPATEVIQKLGLKTSSDVAPSSLVIDGKLITLGADEDGEVFRKRIFNTAELAAYKKFEKNLLLLMKKLPLSDPMARLSPLSKPEIIKLVSISFADWVKQFSLPHKVSEWIRISLECEIGTSWAQISAVDGIAEMHIFPGEGEKSIRVIGGNEKFITSLVDHIGEDHITVNKKVTRIKTIAPNQIQISYQDMASSEASTVEAKSVISTIPLYRLFEVQFEPALSEQKRKAISSQANGDYFKVHVFVKKEAEKFWTTKEHSILPILSDSELGVIYDGSLQQEEGDTKVLSLLVSGPMATAFSYMDYDSVRKTVRDKFEKLWPGFSKNIKKMEMFRLHPRAIAAWPVGRSRFDALSVAIRTPENGVHLAGDFTESSHSDGAFLSAKRAVSLIVGSGEKK